MSEDLASDDAARKRWVETWRRAGPHLEEQRVRELRAMSECESARVFDALRRDGSDLWIPPERANAEGLVEQQKFFMRSHEHPARHRRRR